MGDTGAPQLLAGAAEGPETGYGALCPGAPGGLGAARIGVKFFVFPSMISFIFSNLTRRRW